MQLCDWRRHKRDVVHVAILQYYGIGEVERLGLVTVNERAELVGSRRHVSHSEVALAVGVSEAIGPAIGRRRTRWITDRRRGSVGYWCAAVVNPHGLQRISIDINHSPAH